MSRNSFSSMAGAGATSPATDSGLRARTTPMYVDSLEREDGSESTNASLRALGSHRMGRLTRQTRGPNIPKAGQNTSGPSASGRKTTSPTSALFINNGVEKHAKW